MSTSTNERRRVTSCGGCGAARPKWARWKWCHHCARPTPFCPSCSPAHHHEIRVSARALAVDLEGGQLRALSVEAEGGAELVGAVAQLLGGAGAELERQPVKPDRILPPAFCRLGDTVKG